MCPAGRSCGRARSLPIALTVSQPRLAGGADCGRTDGSARIHRRKVLRAREGLGGRIARAPLGGCKEFNGTRAVADAGAMAQTRTETATSCADASAGGWPRALGRPRTCVRKDEKQLFLALRARQLAALAAADECKRNGGRGQHQEQADRVEYRGRALAHTSVHHDRKRRVRTDQHERRVEVLE